MSKSLSLATLAALWLLAGCGGPAQATPTAIPASVVRPVQPTPAYPGGADVFALLTPGATPQFAPVSAVEDTAADLDASGSARLAIQRAAQQQTPTAIGIAPGGAAIYATRGGRAVASVPVGGVLTVTGKSADGAWYSVYNEDADYGWTPAGQLRVYGSDNLVVVEEAPDPAPVATLLAQAVEPVRVLDDLMAQIEATATQAARQPAATPIPAPAVENGPLLPSPALAAPTDVLEPGGLATGAETGIVSSEGRLNLRARPDVTAAIVRKLNSGSTITILERSSDGGWLRVQLEDGTSGWVAAEFITTP